MKVASTKIANPEWEALQNKCNERGVTIAEYLRELIRADSNKTYLLQEEELSSRDNEQLIVNSKRREPNNTSSLAWLSGKKQSMAKDRPPESLCPVDEMREQVRTQNLVIQDLVSQMKDMVAESSEQKKEYDRAIQLQGIHSKPSCQSVSDKWKTICTLGS